MNDYIRRETAIKICKTPGYNVHDILFALKTIPGKVEVTDDEEQKHGKWMPIYDGNEFGEVYQSGVYCSECDEELQSEPNYCPNCGARMVTDDV